MIDGFPLDQVGIGSGWTLVAMFVYLIATGRLIPKNVHERELAQADAALERAEHNGSEWRTEGRIKDQQLVEKDIQLRHLEEVGKNVLAIMQAMQRRVRRTQDPGGST